MSRSPVSRNAPCPCGSGRKHKRCCQADAERALREARNDDAVARRIQDWAADTLADELPVALEDYFGDERTMDDTDLVIFATWFHSHRPTSDGSTPAERYAARADLDDAERAVAARIAAAQLGLFRVLSVEPGRSLVLEELTGGAHVEVVSPHVSRQAVRWDILLTRLMDGQPPSLFGPTAVFEPVEEPELRAELARLADAPIETLDHESAVRLFRDEALSLLRFVPPSRTVEPSFFTLEGDPLAHATATWHVHDIDAVAQRLRSLAGLAPDEAPELTITARRSDLVHARRPLPDGALVIEESHDGDLDTVPYASLSLEHGQLHVQTMSAERLAETIEIVGVDFGDLVELASLDVVPAADALEDREPSDPEPHRHARDVTVAVPDEQLAFDYVGERMLRWLDEPHPALDQRTPRQAAAGSDHDNLERLLRQLENRAERNHHEGKPTFDVQRLRAELGLDDRIAA